MIVNKNEVNKKMKKDQIDEGQEERKGKDN